MRKGFVVLVFLALGTALFIFTLRGVGLSKVKEALLLLSIGKSILVLVILFLGLIFAGTLKWWIIMKTTMKTSPGFLKTLLSKWVGFSISYLTPAAFFGGEPIRFYILKREHNAPPSKIISSIILDKLILILVSSAYFFVGIFFLLIYLNLSWLAEVISLGLLLFVILLFWFLLRRMERVSLEKGILVTLIEWFYLNKLKLIKKHKEKISEIESETVKFFKFPKKIIWQVIFLAILEITFVMLACWLIVLFMGYNLAMPKVVVIKSMMDLSSTIPFPAALGSLEISQAFVFSTIGFNPASGVAFSLILRGLTLIIVSIGLFILGWFQIKFLGRRIINFISTLFLIKE